METTAPNPPALQSKMPVLPAASPCRWSTGLGPLLLAASGAMAQDMVLEEIVITGTYIQRADYVSPSPVFTLDSETLKLDGTPTLSEFFNQTPQFSPSYDRTSNNPGNGAAGVDLRGLGSNRTLVLVNGRRMGPSSTGGEVDINTIPSVMVDRVEILTGGASSVYGSDAIAGAVNMHLRTDFEGLELGVTYDVTERSDGEVLDFSIVGGTAFADDRGHISGFFSRTDRESIDTADRDFSSVPLQEDFVTGELVEAGSSVAPAGWIPIPGFINGEFSPNGITFDENGNPKPFVQSEDSYNFYSEFNYLQVPLERDTAGVFANFEFTPWLTGFADVMWSESKIDTEVAPIPAFTFALINLDNPFLTPATREVLASNYDPEGTGFFFGPYGIRLSQNGPRTDNSSRENTRISLGLEGELGDGWNWSASYTFTDHEAESLRGNNVIAERFNRSFTVDPATGACFEPADGCVGGNYYGPDKLSDELIDFIRGPDVVNVTTAEQQSLQGILRGDFELFDRTISFATGAEWREDKSATIPDPIAGTGVLLSSGTVVSAISGRQEVWEVFGEAAVPLVEGYRFAESVVAEVGARYSDYSTVGGATSWKLGLTWEAGGGLLLRAMIQQAIRAPSIEELYEADVRDLSSDALYGGVELGDPCSASLNPVGSGVSDICIAQGMPEELLGIYEANPFYPSEVINGGNPLLDAEEGETFTVGFTWQPEWVDGLSLALDYYRIEIDNAITTIGTDSAFVTCFELGDPDSEFCQSFRRDDTGNIALAERRPRNAAVLTTRGFDLQVDYQLDLPSFNGWASALQVLFIGNVTTEFGFQAAPSATYLRCEGYFGAPCNFTNLGVNPEKRATTQFRYRLGGLTTELAWRWIDGLENAGPFTPDFADFPWAAGPGSKNYFDLNFGFEIGDNLSVYAGIANLTDKEPPILGFNAQQSNTIPNLFDVLGRRYHATLRYRL
jgi:iron complex outermembrane receptor protein